MTATVPTLTREQIEKLRHRLSKHVSALRRNNQRVMAAFLMEVDAALASRSGGVVEVDEIRALIQSAIDYHDYNASCADGMGISGSVDYHDTQRRHLEAMLASGGKG